MPRPSANPQNSRSRASAGYERKDANAKWIFGIVFFLLAAGLIMHLVLARFMERLNKSPASDDNFAGLRRDATGSLGNYPRLQISPPAELKDFRDREDQELSTYGWINRTAGVVRIPIQRAMDLALQRGFPTRPTNGGSGIGPSGYELQQQRPATAEKEILK